MLDVMKNIMNVNKWKMEKWKTTENSTPSAKSFLCKIVCIV